MNKRNKLTLWGIVALVVIMVAGVGSYALAQSGSGDQSQVQGQPGEGHDFVSRHVDYDVTLNITGDLSSVDPKLQGVLPLNLSGKGGADIKKGDNGPSAQGNLQLTGLDDVIQKLAANNAAGNGSSALSGPMAGIIGGALSNLDFVMVDHQLYLKVGDVWYSAGPKMGDKAGRGQENDGDKPSAGDQQYGKACVEGAFPGGPKLLLNQQTVGQEDIDGTATTHYSATVDVSKAISDAAAAAKSCGKTDEAAKLEGAQAQIAGAFKQLKLDWWQDGDGQLRQVKAAITVEPASLASLASQVSGDKGAGKAADILKGISSVTLNATLKFSRFGQDFQINKPDGDIKPLPFLKGMCSRGHGQKDNNTSGSTWHRGKKQGSQTSASATM